MVLFGDTAAFATIVVAIIAVIVSACISLRIGYRGAAREAAGRIRQGAQVEISKIRVERNTNAPGRDDE